MNYRDPKTVILIAMITILPELLGVAEKRETVLNQMTPGKTPVVLGPEVISVDNHIEMGCTSSPDGQEIYFGRSENLDSNSKWTIYVVRQQNDGWTIPKVASFSGVLREFYPVMAHDSKYMLFLRFKLNVIIFARTKPKGYYVIVQYDRDDRNLDPNLDDNTWISAAKMMLD